jgi:hypothetical protein
LAFLRLVIPTANVFFLYFNNRKFSDNMIN